MDSAQRSSANGDYIDAARLQQNYTSTYTYTHFNKIYYANGECNVQIVSNIAAGQTIQVGTLLSDGAPLTIEQCQTVAEQVFGTVNVQIVTADVHFYY